MPVGPPSTPPFPTTAGKVSQLISDALQEMGAYGQGDDIQAKDAQFALRKLNRILDQWAARRMYVYTLAFTLYTLQVNLSPHTIGPAAATFAVPQRPTKVQGATIVLTGTTPTTELPIEIRDSDWWNNQRVKNLTSSIPTDLYYSPDYPNGSLYFWPVPDFAYQCRLETWGQISQFNALNDAFNMPPGYLEAITLTLAEGLCPSFQKQLDPGLAAQAQRARTAIQMLNNPAPRIATQDSGMPRKGSGNRADFNWVDGSVG